MLWLDFTQYADTLDCLFPLTFLPLIEALVRYRSGLKLCMIWSANPWRCTISFCNCLLYNINLRATTTTILSIRGVTIPIYLVSSTMDSFKQHVVLFKPVTILTSDPKSEFLCQSSLCCAEPTDPPNHLICLGYLPHPHHHVSSLCSQSKCSHRVPNAEATLSVC